MCSGVQGIGDKADKKGLWKEIIIARYGKEGPWTTQEMKNYLWKGCMEDYQKSVAKNVG